MTSGDIDSPLVSGLYLVMCGALLFFLFECDLYRCFQPVSSNIRGIRDFQKRQITFTQKRTQKHGFFAIAVILFRDTNMAIVRSRKNTLWQNVAQVLSNNRAKRVNAIVLSTNMAAVTSGAIQELVQRFKMM